MKIKIEKLIYEGWGIGRSSDGRVIFVSKSVPGDELEVKITKNKKSYAEGEIEKIIKPSPMRIKPPCPYFLQCGGCKHQNINYPDQLKIKSSIFEEILNSQGINLKSLPIIPGSNYPYFYRNSIRFFFVLGSDGSIALARHNLDYDQGYIEVESCMLQSEKCNEILVALRDYINQNIKEKGMFWQLKIREGKQIGEFMVEIITSAEQLPNREGIVEVLKKIGNIKSIYHTVAPGKSLKKMRRHLLFGSPIIYEKIGPLKFQISPESFFQTNSLGIKKLYDKIKEYAQISPKDSVLDLYCGTGTIGIYLSALAKEVVGVEIIPEAIRDARDNARINKVHNCTFVREDSGTFLSSLVVPASHPVIPVKTGILNSKIPDQVGDDNTKGFDVVVVDPPRAGLTKSLIKSLSEINFKKLIYVSCNPATFARDILEFKKFDLSLSKVQPIDMFPQTHHIECVGLLER